MRKIFNAIQRAEVGERTVEGLTTSQGGDVFGSQQVGLYQAAFVASSNSPSRNFDHLRRIVAGDDLHAAVRQQAGVHPSSATELKNTISGAKCLFKLLPHRCSLGLADL